MVCITCLLELYCENGSAATYATDLLYATKEKKKTNIKTVYRSIAATKYLTLYEIFAPDILFLAFEINFNTWAIITLNLNLTII